MHNVKTRRSPRRRARVACLLILAAIRCLLPAGRARAADDIVVAQDGTGDYTTVQAAILAAPDNPAARTTIFVKAGTYREKIVVPKKANLTLVGEDRATTIITYDDHATVNPDGSVDGTDGSVSFFIKARAFAAEHLTFANTAGDVGPAVAVWVRGTRCHFRDCAFLGYQDTIWLYGKMAYFKRCYIEGAIDIVFGSSTAVFKDCAIHCVGPGFLTAASTPASRDDGFVFKNCSVGGEAPAGSVLLGRPWRDYANVVFSRCDLDDEIAPAGWDDWDDPGAHATAFFAEYGSTGDGADPAGRVDWSHQLTADENDAYSLGRIFHLPATSAGSTPGLTPTPWYEDY